MKKIASLSLFALSLVPSFVFAQPYTTADSILTRITTILSTVIPILIVIAVIYFIWSVIQYTLSSDEEAKAGARKGIITGLIGLFIILSFWGIAGVIQRTFGVAGNKINTENIPCVQANPNKPCDLQSTGY